MFLVAVVFVIVALVRVVHVARLVAVMLMAGLVAVMFVIVALVNVVMGLDSDMAVSS